MSLAKNCNNRFGIHKLQLLQNSSTATQLATRIFNHHLNLSGIVDGSFARNLKEIVVVDKGFGSRILETLNQR